MEQTDRILTLRQYEGPRQVPRCRCAIAPGKHCPLFGVGAMLRGVEGITLIYVGTQDCVYYAQKEALDYHLEEGGRGMRVLAAQLGDSDLIFGIRPQLQKLLEQEALRPGCRAVFLVTSCSVEVLSEDLGSVARAAEEKTGRHIALIRSENFKTFSYFESMDTALQALTQWLEPRPRREKTFALLGARYRGAEDSQPVRFLRERGYTLQSNLPFHITLEQVEELTSVSFTLVMDGTGLTVARRLQRDFGIPYVRFDRRLDPDRLCGGWLELGRLIGEDLTDWVGDQRRELEQLEDQIRPLVTGKTFFYSQVILYPFETCLFLSKLGMEPTCIFLGSAVDREEDARLALAGRCDPRMVQNASTAATLELLAQNTPDYFIGGTVGPEIRRYGLIHLNFRTIPVEAGFDFYRHCLEQLLRAAREGVEYEGL